MLDPKRIAAGWWIAIVSGLLLVSTLLFTLSLLDASFGIQRDVRTALQLNADVLRYQLDEETGLRGYIATGNSLFLEPYDESAPRIDVALSELSSAVGRLDIGEAYASVTLLQRTHDEWVRTVSQPVIESKQTARARFRLPQAKQLMDRFRAASAAVRDAIAARADAADRTTRDAIVRMTVLTVVLVLLAAAGAVLFGRRQRELSRALDHERELVELLQTAFVTRLLPLPRTQIGTAYLSATAQASVGGDFFDVRRLDATYGYVLVGDISGKGVAAAVDTAVVKYGLNALAQRTRDPARMLADFNDVFIRSRAAEEIFVTLFVGVFNSRTFTMRYASAGHAPAFLRRGTRVEALQVTGSAIGLAVGEPYGTRTVRLAKNDTVVLTTDGLTESRDAHGELLSDDGAMAWIAEADAANPQVLADALLDRVRARVGGAMRDDLAILSLRIAGDAVATEDELLADIEEASGGSFAGDLREMFAGYLPGRAAAGTRALGERCATTRRQ